MEIENATWHDADEPASWLPRWFDSPASSVFFGIIAPIYCFAIKRVMLGDALEFPGLRFISIFWIFGYGVVGLGIATLALWMWRGPRLGSWSGIVSGALFACALFAGWLGLVLLPFSLIGLLAVFGVLGFVPFLTAATFSRNAIRAFHQARRILGGPRAWGAIALGAVLVVGVPGSLQTWVSLAVRRAIGDVARGEPSAMRRLRAWYPYAHRDELVWSYVAEEEPARKGRLAKAFRELTGEEIEERLRRRDD
jgi:hypothetical protein